MKTIYKVLITIVIAIIVITQIDFGLLFNNILNINSFWFMISLIPLIPVYLLSAKRWQVILETWKEKIDFKQLFKFKLISIPFSTITPSKAGDLIRAVLLKKQKISTHKGLLSVVIDRLDYILVLLIIGLISSLMIFNLRYEILLVSFSIIIFLVILINKRTIKIILKPFKFLIKKIFYNNQNIDTSFKALYEDMINFLNKKKELIKISLISLIEIIIYQIQIYLTFIAFGTYPGIINVIMISSIASISVLIPITFSGLGLREGTAILLYQRIGISSEITLIVYMILFLTHQAILSLVGLILFQKNK